MTPHREIRPSILYFGTPVALLTTENPDGSFNLAPMSSVWALGQVVVMGLASEGRTGSNLIDRPDVVINLPTAGQWHTVERLAPLTGQDPVPTGKHSGCRFEPDKFSARSTPIRSWSCLERTISTRADGIR